MPPTTMRRVAPLAALLLLAASPAAAQIKASEHASVSQTIDGTDITVDFHRPMAKGRTLFGPRPAVVRWDEAWTPGANWATTVEASRDIYLGGRRLPKGKYGVWLVPRDTGDWTLFLDREARRFHTVRANPDSAVLRLEVRPEQGPHMEGLMWYFPSVGGDTATLRLHWGTTMVTMPVRVDPSKPRVLTTAERAAYLGTYQLTWTREGRRSNTIEIVDTPEGIRGRATPSLMMTMDAEFDLLPVGPDQLQVVVRRDGKPFDTEWMVFHFKVENGRATGFEVPTPKGERIGARGERIR